ncbi:GPP34 family phosphoprotein [Actinomycetes bacterium KLBMP 9797]
MFLLARRRSGFMVAHQSIREALLGAAVLAELRLLHRIDLDPDGTVRVYDPAPTGVPSLDAVLDRMRAAEPRRPHEWATALGPDTHAEVVAGLRGVCMLEPGGNLTWLGDGTHLHARLRKETRARVVAAMHARHTDGPAVVLGTLLWGAELTGEVLRTSYVTRARLEGLAERDWLASAIRRITGNLPPEDAHVSQTDESARSRDEPLTPAVPPRYSWWRRATYVGLPLVLLGGALIAVPVQAHRQINAHTAELRGDGVAIEALVSVRNVDEEKRRSHVRSRITVTLAYEHEGRAYREEVTCEGSCPDNGQTVRIWAARSDLTDFVTEWGDYNTPPSRMMFLGYLGATIIIIALFAVFDPLPSHRRLTGAVYPPEEAGASGRPTDRAAVVRGRAGGEGNGR